MYPNDSIDNWFSGQGHWADVPSDQWLDWKWQLRNRITSLELLEAYLQLTPEEYQGCKLTGSKLALAITPYFLNLMDPKNPNDPLRRQVVPRIDEMYVAPEERLDPLGEETDKVADGIVHRYPDRVLFFGNRPLCGLLQVLHA